MAGNKKKKRQHTIAGRSLLYLVLMGLLMIIGTCVAAGLTLFDRNLQIYEDYAYSYSKTISSNIDGGNIPKYLKMESELSPEDADYGKQLEALQYELLSDPEYARTDALLVTAAAFANLRYVYVIVPQKDDYIYIWYVFHIDPDQMELTEQEKEDMDKGVVALSHGSYTDQEKEAIMSVMEGTWDNSLFLSSNLDDKQLLGKAFSPIYRSDGKIVAVLGVDLDVYDMLVSIVKMCLNVFLAILIILVISMIIFYFLILRRIIRPIVVLKKATEDIVENLGESGSFKVNVHSGDEIEALARSFEEMDDRLKQYLQENMAITAEREHLKTELDLARRIQADMLPSEFPAFPERKEFDIYASMNPAKEVGGDFYDFFLVDEDHLALVIADVSGKGIPAALFMMMSKIMLQNYTLTGLSPKKVLTDVNDQICRNQEEMFVTVWMGILDLKSGIITAANAGHEYPMLKHSGGAFELVKDKHGLVLGGMEGIVYGEYEIKLEPGSTLFVYTDGVAEATDAHQNLFGTQRTLDALNTRPDGTPKELLGKVDRAVSVFVGEAPQFDDLTMLCITYHGSAGENETE